MSCNPHMHTGILIKSPYAHGDLCNPHMHMGIDLNPRMHTGIMCHAIPVCIWELIKSPYTYGDQDQSPYAYVRGLHDMQSPYAYGDQDQSPHAYGDQSNPRMHMKVKINPHMHTGIACHVIPVCILGSICNPRMHTGIFAIPVCIRGSDGH